MTINTGDYRSPQQQPVEPIKVTPLTIKKPTLKNKETK
jgi:hypothetical protein